MSLTRGMPAGVRAVLAITGLAALALMIAFFMRTYETPVLFLTQSQIFLFVIYFTLSLTAILFGIIAVRAAFKSRGGRKKGRS